MTRFVLSLLAGVLAGVSGLMGQSAQRSVVSSLGGSAATANLQVSHTLGEAPTGSANTANLYVGQGFEQAGAGPVSLDEADWGQLKLYPNPAQNQVNLEVQSLQTTHLSVRIIDAQGRVAWEKNFPNLENNTQRQLDLSGLANGSYQVLLKPADGPARSLPLLVKNP